MTDIHSDLDGLNKSATQDCVEVQYELAKKYLFGPIKMKNIQAAKKELIEVEVKIKKLAHLVDKVNKAINDGLGDDYNQVMSNIMNYADKNKISDHNSMVELCSYIALCWGVIAVKKGLYKNALRSYLISEQMGCGEASERINRLREIYKNRESLINNKKVRKSLDTTEIGRTDSILSDTNLKQVINTESGKSEIFNSCANGFDGNETDSSGGGDSFIHVNHGVEHAFLLAKIKKDELGFDPSVGTGKDELFLTATSNPESRLILSSNMHTSNVDLAANENDIIDPGLTQNVKSNTPNNNKENEVLVSWQIHEPTTGAKWPKKHLDCKVDNRNQVYLARRRGRSHEHDGKFCDDDGDFWVHPSGWNVLAVADGAGSAEYSREGSRIAVATVMDEMQRWFTDNQISIFDSCINEWESKQVTFHELFYYQFYDICKAVVATIKSVASEHGLNERQFASTLLVSVSKTVGEKTYIASLWIGDGAIAAYCKGSTRLLGNADSGEFVGQTRFLDMNYLQNHYQKSVSVAAIGKVEAIILMTDGVSDPKFKSDADLTDSACWDRLLNELSPVLSDANPEQPLLEWLHFFERGYHDDRTIIIRKISSGKE